MWMILLGTLVTVGLVSLVIDHYDNDDDDDKSKGGEVTIVDDPNTGFTEVTMTRANETYEGGEKAERVFAGEGNDSIYTNAGNDGMNVGQGNDIGSAGTGQDRIFGGLGDDTMNGGAWKDYVEGGDGNDLIASDDFEATQSEIGGQGAINDLNAQLGLTEAQKAFIARSDVTDNGDDYLKGGEGNDKILDTEGRNLMLGGGGDDLLYALDRSGTDTPDKVYGDPGRDVIYADDGDQVWGGVDVDKFHVVATNASDQAVNIRDFERGETLELHLSKTNGQNPNVSFTENDGIITIANNQQVLATLQARGVGFGAGDLADIKAATTIRVGDETFEPAPNQSSNPDVVKDPKTGFVDVTLTAANETFEGGNTPDRVFAGAGNDMVYTGRNFDAINLGLGDDTGASGPGKDRIFGGLGNDTMNGGSWDDYVEGGDGNDVVASDDFEATQSEIGGQDAVNDLNAQLGLTEAQKTFIARDDVNDRGDDYIKGGEGDDKILDTKGKNVMLGGGGDDLMYSLDRNGTNAADNVYGDPGKDTIIADDGDQVWGGIDTDHFNVVTMEATDKPVAIKDFERGETLKLFVKTADGSVPNVDMIEKNGIVTVSAGNQVLATLQARGVAFGAGDLPDLMAATTVTSL